MADATLDLRPGCLDIEIYGGADKEIAVGLRSQTTSTFVDFAADGWTNPAAILRKIRGTGTVIDLTPAIDVDRIRFTITAAHMADLGPLGSIEIEIDHPAGRTITVARGEVRRETQVGS